ncbi:caspase family protein [Streptomyces ardesiacus]|uniref:caspase family protein n=1 Tax=Streptomyces ardesiacus TaxID=285564 RepID=UPI00368C16CD
MRKSALLVGVGRYGPGFADLAAPPNDVAAFQAVLLADRLGGFDELESLGSATEGTVTRDQFLNALERVADSVGRDDMFVLYFSGHGFRHGGELVLTTSDTEVGVPETGVRATAVKQFLDELVCGVKIVILDCCHAGAFLSRFGAKSDGPVQTLDEAEFGRGTWILAASEERQRAWEADPGSFHAGLSAFTATLLQGIETGRADLDGDGLISIEDLYRYTDHELPYSASQRPTLSALDVRRGGRAVLAQAPLPTSQPGAPVPEAAQILSRATYRRREDQARRLLELEAKLDEIAKNSPEVRESEAYMWVAHTCNTSDFQDLEGMERELLWRLPHFEKASDGRRLVVIGFLGAIGHRSMQAYRTLVSAIISPRTPYELEEALLVGWTHARMYRGETAEMIGEAALFSLYSGDIPPGSIRSGYCGEILKVYLSRSLRAKIDGEPLRPKWILNVMRTHLPRVEAAPFLNGLESFTRGDIGIDQMRQSIRALRREGWYRGIRAGEAGEYPPRVPIRGWRSYFRSRSEGDQS